MKIDHQMFISLYEGQVGALDDSQSSGIDALLGFLEQDTDVSDVRWAAYMLATVKEECAGTWQPIEEYGMGQGQSYGNPVTVTDPNGNTYTNIYYGRGYVQLTWEANYEKMSQNLNLGDQLLYHPEQALDPPTAYDIMSFGMRNGSFTGVGLGDFINDSGCDYVDARMIVNGLDNAGTIAGYAMTLESLLKQSSAGEGQGPGQYHIVNAPDGVNARKGPGTSFPLVHSIANNSPINITCQVQGQVVNGTNIWNQLADGTFVSDFYCDTPYFNKFSPPLPVCQGAQQPSPVPPQPSPVPPTYPHHIVNAPSGVNARKGPGTSFPVVRLVPNGSAIDITCQVQGQVVNGTNIWNQLADGTFVSDFYCDTPYFDKFSPPIPMCQGAPQPSLVPTHHSAVPPGATTYPHHIVNAPNGVNARKGPGTSFPVVQGIANNSLVNITCQVQGQVVNGSNIWNQLSDGTFVSDFYCDTPYFDKFSPPIPMCQGAPQPSPGQPAIKGDDYPFKDSPPDQEGGDPWAFYYRECTSFVAWRMNQLSVNFSNHMTGPNGTAGTFGDGYTWADNALAIGFGVDNTPTVGAIAHYDPDVSGAGDLGHVAYVAQVNEDGTIVIEEYNWFPAYGYSNPPRVIPASDVTSFIHII